MNLIRLRIILFCSLLLQLPYSPTAAQPTGKALTFNALTINDGLSQGMVTCIFQDHFGFMWFATLDGLNRFDGYNFIVYHHNAQDQASITESLIQTIFEDSEGRLWIGTISGGLDLYDRETETFIHIKHQDSHAASLSEGPINSIAEDEQGNIWVHVLDKVDKITINKKEKVISKSILVHHIEAPFHSGNSFLSTAKKGDIYYVAAGNGIVYKLADEKIAKWSVIFELDNYVQQQHTNSDSRYKILDLLEDTVRQKLYIFYEGGLICFNNKSGAPEKIYQNEFFKNYLIPLHASLDRYGVVWFPGINSLTFFDTHSGQMNYATAKDSDIYRSLKHTFNTFIDRSGLLWIGTSGYGILKRNARSEAFHHTSTSYTYSIKEADDRKIILGTNVSAQQLFDKTKAEFVGNIADRNPENKAKEFTGFFTSPIAVDKDGTWFTDNYNLYYYNKILRKSTTYTLPVTANDGYGELIQCRIKDTSGHIWLGTTEGLARFNLTDKQWTVYTTGSNTSSSLSSNLIFSLCLDPAQPKRYLWIGTGGSGLNRMDMITGKCLSYSVKDGLPNNVIYGILNDDDGNLWMSTNKGLSCYDPTRRTFRNFDYKDGLQSNEFNRGAYCRTKDGYLFFGGINGFNYFSPREILKNRTIPQVVITGLKIHNQPVAIQPEGSPLTKVIYLTKELTLRYEQNFISFDFASMDFTNPEQNQYQYKLEGFDKDWIRSGNTNSATYTNLDPGTYIFKVKGSNNDGVWNEKGASVQLIILPPWYMTWWFRTAVVVVVLSLAYAIYRYRIAQALKLQSIRDKIAGDLHDEVGSNLSNIYIFSNVAQQKKTLNETAPLLQKITDYTQQSMEAINDIVWMINTRNDRFENIMVRMRTIAAEFSETSDCLLELNFDENLNDVKLNMEERKNFYLIYKEAINNIAKYAGCKCLWVKMKLDGNIVTLSITDNGIGFDMANTNKGNGMFNMKKRAEMLKGALTVTSTIGEGTTLQLSFKV